MGTLGAAVAAGTRRVTRLELSLRERAATAELQRRDAKVSRDMGGHLGCMGTCWGHRGTHVGHMGTC